MNSKLTFSTSTLVNHGKPYNIKPAAHAIYYRETKNNRRTKPRINSANYAPETMNAKTPLGHPLLFLNKSKNKGTEITNRNIVFLFAGNLVCITTDAPSQINDKSIFFGHNLISPPHFCRHPLLSFFHLRTRVYRRNCDNPYILFDSLC